MSCATPPHASPRVPLGRAAALMLATGLLWGALARGAAPPAPDPDPAGGEPAAAPVQSPADADALPSAPTRSALEDPAASALLDRHYRRPVPEAGTRPPERPGRETFEQRFRIVHALSPHPGMRVADLGPDTGPFAVLFARAVGPEGRVYAIGDSPTFAAEIAALARDYRVEGTLVALAQTPQGTGLAAASIDLAFLGGAYGRLEQPRPILDSLYQALVPYGNLVILEPRAQTAAGDAAGGRSLDRDRAVAEIRDAGFRPIGAPDFLRDYYLLRFEKVGDEPDLEVGPIQSDSPAPQGPPAPSNP